MHITMTWIPQEYGDIQRGLQAIKELLYNYKTKHCSTAENGWYYYTTRFALPIYDNESKTSQFNVYTGCLVVNCTSVGKMYLYDLVDIKKEASNPLNTTK